MDKWGIVYEVERVDGKGMILCNFFMGESEYKDWKIFSREGVDIVEYEESEVMVMSIGRDEV